jgi:hypothetical protein
VVRSPAITRTSNWLRSRCSSLADQSHGGGVVFDSGAAELVSNGKGRHKSWSQQLKPESSEILRVELVTS